MPKVEPFRPRPEVERRKATQQVLHLNLSLEPEVVDALEPEMRHHLAALIRSGRRAYPPNSGRIIVGGFNKVFIVEYNHVLDEILRIPNRAERNRVLAVFAKIVGYIRDGSCEILLSRQQFATQCGMTARKVSSSMTVLERMNAVRRVSNGRGVTYYVNADLVFNGYPDKQQAEAAKTVRPSLQSIDGGLA